MAQRITIIQGHPDPGGNRFCHALADAYAAGAKATAREVRRIEVANLDFPLLRTQADWEKGTPLEQARQRVNHAHSSSRGPWAACRNAGYGGPRNRRAAGRLHVLVGKLPGFKGARAHLLNATSQDPNMKVRDFEVDHEPKNMSLLGKVYEGRHAGLLVRSAHIVGPDVTVGYTDDATTGHKRSSIESPRAGESDVQTLCVT